MKPTIGRPVWYHPAPSVTHAAQIAHVHSDTCVNLAVVDTNGVAYNKTSVLLVNDNVERPTGGSFCEWMPYQKRQADQPDALEAKPMTPADTSDAAIERDIQAKGLTAPRVTPDQIDAMMARVTYQATGFLNTTSIIVAAFLDGEFYLGCGHSACVSKDNFDPEIGCKIAKGAAVKVARDKLLELEGYALRGRLGSKPKAKIHVCGVTCYRGDANCNNYCIDSKVPHAKLIGDDASISRRPNPADGAPKPAGHNPVG